MRDSRAVRRSSEYGQPDTVWSCVGTTMLDIVCRSPPTAYPDHRVPPSRPHPAPLYYYISQTGCQDPGSKSAIKSYYFWDPGWTRAGPGSDPGWTRAPKVLLNRITFGTRAPEVLLNSRTADSIISMIVTSGEPHPNSYCKNFYSTRNVAHTRG